jgi:hypothetical protein
MRDPTTPPSRTRRLVALGTIALVAALATALFAWWNQPTRITIALDGDSLASRILQRYVDLGRRERLGQVLTATTLPDSAERARQFEARRFDVGVFRLDEALPRNGSAVALVQDEVLLVVARAGSRITKIPELARRRLALAAEHPADINLVRQVLEAYRSEAQTTVFANDDARARAAFAAGEVDALAIVARPDGERARRVFDDIARAAGGAPAFLPVEVAVVRSLQPHLEEVKVAAALIDPRRTLPAAELTTVGVRRAVLASRADGNAKIAAFTRLLFERRDSMAQRLPFMTSLQPPPTDRGTSLPVHPGAAEYIGNSEMDFITRYSDYIWIGLCFTGVFGALFGAIYTRYRFSAAYGLTHMITDLATAGRKAAHATDPGALCTLERDLAERVLAAARDPRFAADDQALELMQFTFDTARFAIDSRRRELGVAGGGRGFQLVRT